MLIIRVYKFWSFKKPKIQSLFKKIEIEDYVVSILFIVTPIKSLW